ncbi:MAG: 4Fe-4S ferredoxin iron-sulfur binding domain protein [Herbinix sp.]|nr:4Fe-4S ferredoxin iron-sulfur binding domain protein [Herbinix sp.]
MGHITSKDAYKNLEERINWFTQGAPPSDSLYKILQVLYTEKEAKWVARLPIRPFTAKKAAKIWNTSEGKAEAFLEHLCEKALLVDSFYNGVRQFVMPPPMAGFIEFALMRTRGDIDQKYLSELYYQYMNVEEDFVKDLFYATETHLGRVYVQEPVLMSDNTIHILDYERASHIIEEASHIGLGTCYCRHKMLHAGHPCEINAPLDVCLTFGNVARSLAEHGQHAKLIDKKEAMDVLERSYAANLVQIGENVREDPAFICNCCGCCCEALQAARKFSPMQPVATTNYIPKITEECVGCGKCEKVCPVLAISMQEKGTLQNLIFDNQAFANHRAMAATLGVILRLPPLKQMMASKQFKSIYLDKLLSNKSVKKP